MNETKEKRAGYVSMKQKNRLFSLMQDRPALCSGRFSTSFTKKDGQKEWLNIATTLNANPGGNKSWMQWRKTWQDMRSKVKTKQATIKRHASGTGGGPPLPLKLKQNEEEILSLISNVAVNGHSSVQESFAHFDLENTEESNTTVPALPTMVDTSQIPNNDIFMDHYYCKNDAENCAEEIVFEVQSGPDIIKQEPENPAPIVVPGSFYTPTSVKKHTDSSAKKLQVAASATALLSESAKEKLIMKREYYERKLGIVKAAEDRKICYYNKIIEIKEKKIIDRRKTEAFMTVE